MHAGGVQHAAARARHQLRTEQRRHRARERHPRREDWIPFRARPEAINRRIRQHPISQLQHDKDRQPKARLHALQKSKADAVISSKNAGDFEN